jgi:hypothetical protein
MLDIPMLPHQPKRPPEPLLELLYDLPRPMRSLEDYQRLTHCDLPAMTERELERELGRTWLRIMLSWPPTDDWLWARRDAVFAERDRRRSGVAR